MHRSMLRLAITCALGAGGMTVAGCGNNDKPAPEDGWETTEFTEPAPPDDTPSTDEPDDPPISNNEVVVTDLAPDGAACDTAADCEGGTCLTGPDWQDGYCTTDACDGSCDSPDSGCVDSDLGNFCAEYCTHNSDCRTGYGCQSQPGSPGRVCVPATGLADGEACNGNDECGGDLCFEDWPDGFCTTTGCDDFEDCNRPGDENNKCLRSRGGNFCVRICTLDSECREGYVCEMFGNGEGMCYPDPAIPFDDDILQGNPFDIVCQPTSSENVTIDFNVAPDTVAYMVTPIAKDGRQIYPGSIARPTGADINFRGANQFQSIPAYLYGGMNPTVVPATGQFSDQLEPGAHQYRIQTDSAEVCHYMLEETEFGDTIDLNIYFVGINGLNAGNASSHADMQEVLTQFDEIWGPAGITTGKVRYFDITGDDADRYSVLRSDQAVSELVQLTKRPGDTLDDVLSLNIFFTRAFAMGGAIGISLGLPGPAGLHGTHGSGVAFTAEYLGTQAQSSLGGQDVDGNVFTGQILAHEVGHYIGLFHTSEDRGAGFDPLPDTPECARISLQCPDIDNLMFPYAGASHVSVTPDQEYVVKANPLTKLAIDGGSQ